MGANFLIEGVVKYQHKSIQGIFNTIKTHSIIKQGTLRGLLRVRRLLKQNRRSKLRKALYHWYFSQLKPLRNLKQAHEAPLVLQKRHPAFLAYYRWKSAYTDSIIRSHYQQQKVNRMVTLLSHQRSVAGELAMQRWRGNIHPKYSQKHKIKALTKMLKDK